VRGPPSALAAVHSYGLIWVGQNYLARDAGIGDSHDEVLAYMRFSRWRAVDEVRLAAFVARSPEVLKFFADCGIRFWLVRGVTDHYYEKAPGSHAVGRTVEAELISGVELGIGATAAPGGAGRLQCAEVRLTLRWRGLDSHFWFRAEMGLASRHHPRGAAEW